MIEITERPISDSERKILLDQIPSMSKRIENGVLAFIFILLIFIAPLLLIDKYLLDGSPAVELIVLAPILIITTYLVYRFDKKNFDVRFIIADIDEGTVTVYNIKSDRVIKRRDPEDLGPGYYFDLGQSGEYKTLFLFGQYLVDLGKKKFPCKEFQVVKAKSGQVINLIPIGEYLKPGKTLRAFSKEDFKNGKVPDDGQLMKISIDELAE